jgi:hypothetical protein
MEHPIVNRDEREDTMISKIVVNREEQASIRPPNRENLLSWKAVGTPSTEVARTADRTGVWTEMLALNLYKTMAGA